MSRGVGYVVSICIFFIGPTSLRVNGGYIMGNECKIGAKFATSYEALECLDSIEQQTKEPGGYIETVPDRTISKFALGILTFGLYWVFENSGAYKFEVSAPLRRPGSSWCYDGAFQEGFGFVAGPRSAAAMCAESLTRITGVPHITKQIRAGLFSYPRFQVAKE